MSMKFIYILPTFVLLASCGPDPIPCMASNEKGKVVRSQTDTQEYCGRGGCSRYDYTYINIEVNGVSRTCVVDRSTSKMFGPGETINLQTGRRL